MKIKYLLLLCFLMVEVSCMAQQSQIDSLQKILKTTTNDTVKINLLNQLAINYAYSKPDSGIFYAQNALKLSQSIGNKVKEVYSLNNLGGAYSNKGNLKSALEYLQKGLAISQEIENKQLASESLTLIGLIYRSSEKHQQSLIYFYQAISFLEKMPKTGLFPIVLSNIGRAYNYLGQYDSASYFLEKSLSIFQKDFPKQQSIALINLGDVKFRTKQYEEAKNYLLKGAEIAKTIYPRDVAVAYRILSEIYLLEGNIPLAEKYIDESVTIAQSGNFKYFIAQTYRVYADVLEAKGDIVKALKYKNLFTLYRDSVVSEASQNSMKLFEYEREQGQIAILQKEKALEVSNREKQQSFFIFITLLFVVFFIILAYIIWQKQRVNRVLAQQKSEILKQKEVLEKQSEELNSLNKEKDKIFSLVAHDLRSPLASLKNVFSLFSVDGLSQEDFFEILPELQKQVNYSFDLTEELLYWAKSQMNVMQIVLKPIVIEEIFKGQVEKFESPAKVKELKLHYEITPDIATAYADVDMLNNVLRNLIANAIKFCKKGDSITLKAENEADYLKIVVIDTGVGIAPTDMHKLFVDSSFTTRGTANEKGTGLGLLLCKDFVEKNGGKIWVESVVNQGSTFYFTLKRVA